DAPRHRGPGRARDRSRTAALLSPLRAGPALRHSDQARVARPAGGGRRRQSDSPPHLKFAPGLRAPEEKPGQRASARAPPVSARLASRVTLEAFAIGKIIASRDGSAVDLGTFSAAAADRAQDLRAGLPLAALAAGGRAVDKEVDLLVRRLAWQR